MELRGRQHNNIVSCQSRPRCVCKLHGEGRSAGLPHWYVVRGHPRAVVGKTQIR